MNSQTLARRTFAYTSSPSHRQRAFRRTELGTVTCRCASARKEENRGNHQLQLASRDGVVANTHKQRYHPDVPGTTTRFGIAKIQSLLEQRTPSLKATDHPVSGAGGTGRNEQSSLHLFISKHCALHLPQSANSGFPSTSFK